MEGMGQGMEPEGIRCMPDFPGAADEKPGMVGGMRKRMGLS
jgi:hypothetical protein